MLTQGYRNLIKSSTFLDQSFQQLLKKSDQYRKSSKMSLDYMQNIYKFFETHQAAFQKMFYGTNEGLSDKSQKNLGQIREMISIFERVFKAQNDFGKKFGSNIKETVEMSSDLFNNYSNLIASFQCAIRAYIKNQQNLFQQSKRYFKQQKILLHNLQVYKTSFTDVKLIYNNDEKIKRYAACDSTYKILMQELKNIQQRVVATNKLKKEIAQNYKRIEYQFTSAIKIVGNRIITLAQLFVFEQQELFGSLSSFLFQKSKQAIKIKFGISFNAEELVQQEQQESMKQNKKYPYFIIYFANAKSLKPQFYPEIVRLFNNFIKQISQKIQIRKKSQKNLYDFIFNYFKQFQRSVLGSLRELNTNYDKNKKKISELYGSKHISFMKTFSIIFQKIVQNGDILNKSISLRVKAIQNIIQQSSKIMDPFLKDAKLCFQRNSKKRQIKKTAEQQLIESESLRVQMQEKSMQLQVLIDSLQLKLNQNQAQLNIHCNSIINDMLGNALQISQFCKQFHQDQFQQSTFMENYQSFQTEVDEILKAKITIFSDLSFASILSQKDDLITFQPELNKIEQFKKIKKPADYDSQSLKKRESMDQDVSELQIKSSIQTPRKISTQDFAQRSPEKSQEKDKMQKYEQFLLSKFAFKQGEKYIKSYACGLSDKIILTGRLFVTTQRLCFYSKFNPNNVFFGQTFIQIPRKDILKVEKRQNAIIFNNSISVTTVNGQMFFTSFFARNQAYDTICQSLQISVNQEIMFEPVEEEIQEQVCVQQSKEDDLKPQKQSERAIQIDKLIEPLEYIEIHVSEYTSPGLNAYKFFKLFDSSNQISYVRKTFKGFNIYFKQLIQHKQIVIDQWSPILSQFMNPVNIKQACPINFERVSTSIIPVANSGIPLMPKQAHMHEQSRLHFYSKDKYVIVTKVQNSGIPYCEYFNIRFKKVIQTVSEDKCRFTLYYYIDFVQKTMMRSVIQSKSIEECKIATGKLEIQMKKYLKYLQKLKAKTNQNESLKQNVEQKVLQLQKELQESKERQQKLEKQTSIKQQKLLTNKKFLLASVAINILLIMIIVNLY